MSRRPRQRKTQVISLFSLAEAFLEAEDGIAVLRHAVKNPDLAGAAGSFATGGQKAGAGAVDGVQDGVVRGVLPACVSSGALQRRE